MMIDPARTFYCPVAYFLFFEPAIIADKFLHFIPSVFAGCYAQHFIALHPQAHLATALGTIPVRIYRFCEPNPAFKPESTVGQRAYRADINHIPGEIIIYNILYIRGNFRMIAPVDHPMHTVVRDLLAHFDAAVTQDTPVHMQLDGIPDIQDRKSVV